MRIATIFGLLAIGLLLANATLSIFAVSQAASRSKTIAGGDTLNAVIGMLGMGTIMANGLWYVLANWSAYSYKMLPRCLCWLGLAIGTTSLVPFLALVVLVLGIVWAIWLAIVLRGT